ncbi:DUF58 domain-containing protein [Luteimonas sp. JM171]|uniref:DUF58 domain-containing protein n=1 Tax=Luteimonas sp. JM171 TaxID=1896164 RepID=UPI000855F44B|nr:DUF58 domain-containing protein [Luteimonas sp. JM171]AOH36578.1 hypothetical protein BGP89_09605 [Luteimonas sp. JM171]
MRSPSTEAGRRGLGARLQLLARPRAPETLPVQFDRRRIFVLPTWFGLFFLVLLLTMGVGALNYNNNPALLLALVLTGTALASLLAAHLQLSGLVVHAVGAEPVAAGKPLLLRVHVRADPRRPRRGLLVESGDASAVLSLYRGAGEATLELPTTVRGWRHTGRLRISTTRPLGLARAWSWVWPEKPQLVYPAPEPGGPPLPLGAGDHAQARLHPAGDDVHHLRTWRRGDSRRAIAWKPSAKRDSLLVREYEEPQGADVVLDWNALGALPPEAKIQRLARWVDEAEREQCRYRLVLPGQPPLGPGSGPAHRHACLRALALLPGAGEA